MRVHAFRVDDVPGVVAVVLAADLDPVSEAREAYLSSVFPLALLAVGLALVSGWLVSRRALRPVARMTGKPRSSAAATCLDDWPSVRRDDELSLLGRT